ncbi:Interleukin-1 receptor accessory protein [Microtus ochrogaster]|uniref:Interleukin-1 receptor accessory protein n=1 Tax=Microtus ochrogaster TaxID=79684 RepID=A0A8J6G7Y6_MICOH|nr:Interleukin-1 receptor accessory protein [Microtus ochrogaster]
MAVKNACGSRSAGFFFLLLGIQKQRAYPQILSSADMSLVQDRDFARSKPVRLGVQGGAVPALSVWLRARPAAGLAFPRALRPGTAGPRGGTQRSPASARRRAPCDSSSQRAGLARVPPPPHPWEARLAGGARANKAGGACGRIPGPIARWRGRSPGGEKESAAESKRLVGGLLSGSGSPGLSLDPASERDSGRSPCTHPVAVAEPRKGLFWYPCSEQSMSCGFRKALSLEDQPDAGICMGAKERCDDWGLDTMRQIQVFEDEPARIKCPLFEHFLKYNYSTAHSSGLTLIWYWTRQDRDLEEPINFRLPENRIRKEKDELWFRPTLLNDTGNYTCMLRNTTYCCKVAFPLEVIQKDSCFNSPMRLPVHKLYIEHSIHNITCPNVDGYFPPSVKPAVTWYKGCTEIVDFHNVLPEGMNLTFFIPLVSNKGNYTCVVTYLENGRLFHLTRTMSVKVVGSPKDALPPQIYSPNDRVVYEKEPGEELLIPCKVYFTFIMDSHNEIWWTIDGKKPDDVTADVTINESLNYSPTEDETRTQTLSIKKVTPEDLRRNYVCHARNTLGEAEHAAKVKQKALVIPPRYTVELACGFGATVFLVVVLIVVYHVYWLEMVLFYRAHFGTDETILDGKEYDIYVSYARNAEEEEFVLLTLRGVLENEFGYKLCIFDRDSLPGGIVTDETLSFIQKSRRLLVVLSPNYVLQGTQALLELKAGLENMASRGNINVILVQYKAVKDMKVKELKRAKTVLTVIKWKGEKSKYPQGRFWKQLQVAMPVKKSSRWSSSDKQGLSYSSLKKV